MNDDSFQFWPPRGKTQPPGLDRPCEHAGCALRGEFRAPKSRDALHEYVWFCLDHVRAYNKAWDYYAGMPPDEIEDMVRFDVTWQRPTWPLGSRTSGHSVRMEGPYIHDPLGVFESKFWSQPAPPRPPSPQADALREMNLDLPLTLKSLKARYKTLCKLYHPDANGGDKLAEERFKRVGQAYRTLMESLDMTGAAGDTSAA
jgi:hypothetical protein